MAEDVTRSAMLIPLLDCACVYSALVACCLMVVVNTVDSASTVYMPNAHTAVAALPVILDALQCFAHALTRCQQHTTKSLARAPTFTPYCFTPQKSMPMSQPQSNHMQADDG